VVKSDPRIDIRPARKQVQRGVTILRPGMNGKVGFGDDYRAGNPVGLETVEHVAHDGGAAQFRSPQHLASDDIHIIERGGFAPIQLDQDVPSELMQFPILQSQGACVAKAG